MKTKLSLFDTLKIKVPTVLTMLPGGALCKNSPPTTHIESPCTAALWEVLPTPSPSLPSLPTSHQPTWEKSWLMHLDFSYKVHFEIVASIVTSAFCLQLSPLQLPVHSHLLSISPTHCKKRLLLLSLFLGPDSTVSHIKTDKMLWCGQTLESDCLIQTNCVLSCRTMFICSYKSYRVAESTYFLSHSSDIVDPSSRKLSPGDL